jgi:hypothetical protein
MGSAISSPCISLGRASLQKLQRTSIFLCSRGTLFSSTARVGIQPKAKDHSNHCATGLEYSGPISEVVTLDDPADVTLLYEPFLVDFGWSSSSLCLSGAAAGS